MLPVVNLYMQYTERPANLPHLSEPHRNEALHGVAGEGAIAVAGIGACFHTGGVLGKKKCATSFPAAITTACAFNRSLVRAIGSAVGTEARVFSNLGHAGLTFWTPNVCNHTIHFPKRMFLTAPYIPPADL